MVGFLAEVAGTAEVCPGTAVEEAWPGAAAGALLAGEEVWLAALAGL